MVGPFVFIMFHVRDMFIKFHSSYRILLITVVEFPQVERAHYVPGETSVTSFVPLRPSFCVPLP